ncbi:hypothetical protein Tco_0812855 [Tanacetum coccineum]
MERFSGGVSYTEHFQELALLCSRMVPEEYDKVEKYVGGLPDSIQGNVMSARPKMLQEAIELANTRAYTAGPSEKKEYAGTLPLCNSLLSCTQKGRAPLSYSKNPHHACMWESSALSTVVNPEIEEQNFGNQNQKMAKARMKGR